MGLETGTYISDLVATNPLSSDLASTSDDHLRLIKSCIKATFPNITGAVTLTQSQINDAAQLSASNSFTGTLTLGDGGDAVTISGSSLSLSPNISLPNAGAAGNRTIKISDRDDAQMSVIGGSGASPATLQLFGGAYTNFAGAVFIDAGSGSGGTNDGFIVMRKGGTTRFVIDVNGRVYGTALHNNASSPTGTSNQYIASGTYTPTLTNTTNISSSTAYASQWMRVGNVVTVSGKVSITPTVTARCVIGISLPLASNFTAEEQCCGSLVASVATSLDYIFGGVFADTTNDRASVEMQAQNNISIDCGYTFTYLVL